MVKQTTLRCVLLLFLSWTFAGCLPQTFQQSASCVDVRDMRLASFPFDRATDQTVVTWIVDNYGVGSESIRTRASTAGIRYWDWESGSKSYTASFWQFREESSSVGTRWRQQAPTISDVLRCLGAPKSYRAYYQPNPDAEPWSILELWYPEQGLLVRALVKRKVAGFDEQVALDSVQYARPGTEEDLIARFWVVEPNSDPYNRILRTLKPWPGTVRGVQTAPQS